MISVIVRIKHFYNFWFFDKYLYKEKHYLFNNNEKINKQHIKVIIFCFFYVKIL